MTASGTDWCVSRGDCFGAQPESWEGAIILIERAQQYLLTQGVPLVLPSAAQNGSFFTSFTIPFSSGH